MLASSRGATERSIDDGKTERLNRGMVLFVWPENCLFGASLVLSFCRLNVARTEDDIAEALGNVVLYLSKKTTEMGEPRQIPLFKTCDSLDVHSAATSSEFAGKSVNV